jgi:hypothetical protein
MTISFPLITRVGTSPMAANPVTDYDRRIVREMWTDQFSVDEIADKLGRAHGTVQYIAAAMRLGPKPLKPHQSVWTPEIVEAMRVAWFDGHSATAVAEIISKRFGLRLTRNATIGKIHRMGFVRSHVISDLNKTFNPDEKLKAARKANAEKAAARKLSVIGRNKAVRQAAARIAKGKPTRTAVANPNAGFGEADVREPWVIVTDAAWDILPGTDPKTLINRRNFGECKYPVGMNEPEQRFCCARTAQTYCDAHRAIMYRPNPDKLDVRHLMRIR